MKEKLKKIRLAINRFGSKKRAKKLKVKPSIISNNCWAGILYEYLGIEFLSPTIGLYFYSDEYIKFLSNLDYYLKVDLKFIEPRDSKYYDDLVEKQHNHSIIGILGDVEIVFLHYKSKEEAYEKWTKRCKRVDKNNLIVKFCNQNLCTEKNIYDFDKLKYKNKLFFSNKEYPNLKSVIWFKGQRKYDEIKKDYYECHKYLNIIDYINNLKR